MTCLPWKAAVCAGLVGQLFLHAQTAIDLRTQAKNVDFSQAAATKPNKSGTALPATCGVGETFFLTSAPAGGNLYGCAAANAWSPLGSGAGSLPAANMPGQVLAWTGASWQAKSSCGRERVADILRDRGWELRGTIRDASVSMAGRKHGKGDPPAQYCDASGGTCYALSGIEAVARVSSLGVATVRVCNLSGASQALPAANYSLVPYAGGGTTVGISFPAITDGGCSTQTIVVPGVTAASAVALGLPPVLEPGLIVTAAPGGLTAF